MSQPLRIAVLWPQLSGYSSYLSTCLKSLIRLYDVELQVVHVSNPANNPNETGMFSWLPNLHPVPDGSRTQAKHLLDRLTQFNPHAAIVSGWSVPAYRRVAVHLRARNVHVIGAIDNPWTGALRQRIGVLISRWYVQPLFDTLWVPGERGAVFARKLGYSGNQLMEGLLVGNTGFFNKIAMWRAEQDKDKWPRRFLYAGRFSEEKGIEDLMAAYERYRSNVEEPWDLWLAGSGPLEHLVEGIQGVRNLGFTDPRDYPAILRQVGVFILPSHYDHWGVVIHEMTAAGLPILCSRECGSSVELVQDGYNGYLFEARDVEGMAELMIHVTTDSTNLPMMGQRSAQLSTRYSPEQWAHYLMSYLSRRGIRN